MSSAPEEPAENDPKSGPKLSGHRDHLLMDAADDDWAWRRAIRQRPAALLVYRTIVFTLGGILIIGGLILVPLPGPGWLVVFMGLAVLASEFEPAHQLLEFGKDRLRRWDAWVRARPLWLQGLAGLLLGACVLALVWVTLRLTGIPAVLPDVVGDWLVRHAGLARRVG